MSATDKYDRAIAFGDEVDGGLYGKGIFIGIMTYSRKDHTVIAIADERSTGMPLNSGHVQLTGRRDRDLAERKRTAYLKLMPGAFLPRLIDLVPDAEAGDADPLPESA